MRGIWHEALRGLRQRRARTLLSALGIALAASMLATAVIVAYSLHTGFERSASRADLPDVIARFDEQRLSKVGPRVRALPGLVAASFRYEVTNIPIAGGGHTSRRASVEVIGSGRRGFAILAGHPLRSRYGEVLVEQGLARSWDLRPGSTLNMQALGPLRVVGISESPDNVAYPLAAPRVYVSRRTAETRFGREPDPVVNTVEFWVRDPRRLDEVLVQARATSYGIPGLRFVTRAGVKILLDEAAGIVIALLVALSAIALLTASVMLASSARAEVQRRLPFLGLRRALGATRTHVTLTQAAEALLVSVPASAAGVLAGTLLARGPTDRLLGVLNELPPGGALFWPLAGCCALTSALPVLSSAWPVWRSGARPPIALMTGLELRAHSGEKRRSRRLGRRGGALVLGSRLVTARRVRLLSTVTVLGTSVAFILLMLALASELSELANNPAALGKRYALTAALPASSAPSVGALPGVAAAAPRYEVQALDAYSLGETIDLIGYPGDHTVFEAPSLAAGRRLRGGQDAEVGVGLAEVLGLQVGSQLVAQLPSGREARFRVAGIVDSLQHDGRVAYVSAAALLAAEPAAGEQIAIRLRPNADRMTVTAGLRSLGATPTKTTAAVGTGQALIAALTSILRLVAIVNGLVCLYALIQALVLTARERRMTIGVLRACGAGAGTIRVLLAGAAATVVLPAALAGIVLERLALGPALARLAAAYAALALGAGVDEIAIALAGFALFAFIAVVWVARASANEKIVGALRG
jgi:ABC-type antimicrobial peptide transport system permease subunit